MPDTHKAQAGGWEHYGPMSRLEAKQHLERGRVSRPPPDFKQGPAEPPHHASGIGRRKDIHPNFIADLTDCNMMDSSFGVVCRP